MSEDWPPDVVAKAAAVFAREPIQRSEHWCRELMRIALDEIADDVVLRSKVAAYVAPGATQKH